MVEIDKKKLGERIKGIRLQKGETAEQFGKHFEPIANRSLVSAWENGRYIPNPDRLKVIAELGETTIDDLLLGEIDKEQLIINQIESHISNFPFTNSEREFLNSIKEELIPLILNRVKEYENKVHSLGYWFLYVEDRLENLADVHSSALSTNVFDISFEELNLPKVKEDLEYFYTNISSLDYETLTRELNKKTRTKKNLIEERLNSTLQSDQEHEINKPAFEDTVDCFSETNINFKDMDFMTVYMQNLYYREGKNGHKINSKESYLNFLNERINLLEERLKEENLSLMDKSTFEMVLKIDKATIKEINK